MSFQAYLDNIKAKTGMSPEDFIAAAQKKGMLEPGIKVRQVVEWLKHDYGLGHGHAMAIVNVFKHATGPKVSSDDRITRLFSGQRAVWRKHFNVLLEKLRTFGPDVYPAATDTYISLLRGKNKFGIVQVTTKHMDIGIKLKGAQSVGRLKTAGDWNAMVTHRVQITDPKQLDDELYEWLRQAYDKAS